MPDPKENKPSKMSLVKRLYALVAMVKQAKNKQAYTKAIQVINELSQSKDDVSDTEFKINGILVLHALKRILFGRVNLQIDGLDNIKQQFITLNNLFEQAMFKDSKQAMAQFILENRKVGNFEKYFGLTVHKAYSLALDDPDSFLVFLSTPNRIQQNFEPHDMMRLVLAHRKHKGVQTWLAKSGGLDAITKITSSSFRAAMVLFNQVNRYTLDLKPAQLAKIIEGNLEKMTVLCLGILAKSGLKAQQAAQQLPMLLHRVIQQKILMNTSKPLMSLLALDRDAAKILLSRGRLQACLKFEIGAITQIKDQPIDGRIKEVTQKTQRFEEKVSQLGEEEVQVPQQKPEKEPKQESQVSNAPPSKS